MNFMKIFNSRKKEEGPLLSVIMPVYNHEKYVGEAMESVLKQTYRNFEFIIIDDGSSDNSVKQILKYQDKRIRFYKQENRGAHNAINRGLSNAEGEYIAILNSDDVYELRRFEKMIAYMEQERKVGFCCSYIQVIDTKGKKLGIKKGWKNMEPWLLEHPERSLGTTDEFEKNLIISNFTSTTSNFLFRREVYEKIGGMRNLRFAHDWDFALRVAQNFECEIIKEPLLLYRVHENNTISSNRKWMMFEIAWVWAANISRFAGTLFFRNENSEREDMLRVIESINLQGNDKIFWIILLYIQFQERKGMKYPEERLLDDEKLRNLLLDYVVE